MTLETHVTVSASRHFDAPAERVFDAWLDTKNVGKWLFGTPSGEVVKVEIDARVGGAFTIVDCRDREDIAHTGVYQEIDRPRRLAFTFGVPRYSPEFSRVDIDIVALETGCELTLTQENVLSEYAERSVGGWRGILEGLAKTLG